MVFPQHLAQHRRRLDDKQKIRDGKIPAEFYTEWTRNEINSELGSYSRLGFNFSRFVGEIDPALLLAAGQIESILETANMTLKQALDHFGGYPSISELYPLTPAQEIAALEVFEFVGSGLSAAKLWGAESSVQRGLDVAIAVDL